MLAVPWLQEVHWIGPKLEPVVRGVQNKVRPLKTKSPRKESRLRTTIILI